MLEKIGTVQTYTGTNQDAGAARLKTICAEFESIYMTYMLKSMRTAMVEEGIMGNSHESKIIHAMFDENLALEVSRGGGIGLGKVLFERLAEASGLSSEKDPTEETKDGGAIEQGYNLS
jgi:flagellar protein FlgJ